MAKNTATDDVGRELRALVAELRSGRGAGPSAAASAAARMNALREAAGAAPPQRLAFPGGVLAELAAIMQGEEPGSEVTAAARQAVGVLVRVRGAAQPGKQLVRQCKPAMSMLLRTLHHAPASSDALAAACCVAGALGPHGGGAALVDPALAVRLLACMGDFLSAHATSDAPPDDCDLPGRVDMFTIATRAAMHSPEAMHVACVQRGIYTQWLGWLELLHGCASSGEAAGASGGGGCGGGGGSGGGGGGGDDSAALKAEIAGFEAEARAFRRKAMANLLGVAITCVSTIVFTLNSAQARDAGAGAARLGPPPGAHGGEWAVAAAMLQATGCGHLLRALGAIVAGGAAEAAAGEAAAAEAAAPTAAEGGEADADLMEARSSAAGGALELLALLLNRGGDGAAEAAARSPEVLHALAACLRCGGLERLTPACLALAGLVCGQGARRSGHIRAAGQAQGAAQPQAEAEAAGRKSGSGGGSSVNCSGGSFGKSSSSSGCGDGGGSGVNDGAGGGGDSASADGDGGGGGAGPGAASVLRALALFRQFPGEAVPLLCSALRSCVPQLEAPAGGAGEGGGIQQAKVAEAALACALALAYMADPASGEPRAGAALLAEAAARPELLSMVQQLARATAGPFPVARNNHERLDSTADESLSPAPALLLGALCGAASAAGGGAGAAMLRRLALEGDTMGAFTSMAGLGGTFRAGLRGAAALAGAIAQLAAAGGAEVREGFLRSAPKLVPQLEELAACEVAADPRGAAIQFVMGAESRRGPCGYPVMAPVKGGAHRVTAELQSKARAAVAALKGEAPAAPPPPAALPPPAATESGSSGGGGGGGGGVQTAAGSSRERRRCSVCGSQQGGEGRKPLMCRGCRRPDLRYCGPECQRVHWQAGHREECKLLQQQRAERQQGG